ncbi:MAG: hypothetical protein K2X47_12925, partial [Bdellovibrionales bacterium]|nr:hypothetical protein [Bdellovibrionales bacterium]
MQDKVFSFSPNPSVIRISGSDRLDFLHRLTSQSFKARKPGEFFYGACLQANGGAIGLFGAWIRLDEVLLIPLGRSSEPILRFFDQFHFGEDIRFESTSEFQVVHLFGEGGTPPPPATDLIAHFPGPLTSVLGNDSVKNQILLGLTNQKNLVPDGRQITDSECATLYAWYGLPEAGRDLTTENILIEAPLDPFVHRTKGCYPGQEVIERIYTYGNVAKYVLNLKLDPPKSQLFDPNKLIGSELFIKRTAAPEGTADVALEKSVAMKAGNIRSVRELADGAIFAVAQLQRLPAEKNKAFGDALGNSWMMMQESL